MYQRIAVAFDESAEAGRALATGIDLAKTLGVGLQSITVMEGLPAYTAFASGADAVMAQTIGQDRQQFYEQLVKRAQATAAKSGVELIAHLKDGEEAESLISFVCERKIDLLVIGIHNRSDRVSRLWSTVFTVAQKVPCSVLGVH